MSQGSPILWIELEDIETAEMLQHQANRMRNPNGQAIMYPPQELYPSITSIQNNCKEQKIRNPNLRYQVKLGEQNIELWTKQLGEIEYKQVELTIYGQYTLPKLDKAIILPTLGVSPSLEEPRKEPERTRKQVQKIKLHKQNAQP